MTHEELYGICECYNVDFSDYITIKEHIESLEQRNTELEQQIKELQEPKTCDRCIWNGSKYDEWSEHCGNCCRSVIQEDDYYEPKQN